MKIHALIVDDEEEIGRTVGDIVKSLNHTYDYAGDIETATECLEAKKYQYLILDMNIPVAPGRLTGRRENGRNFIHTIRANERWAAIPIIVVTGQDKGESEFILSVVGAGGIELTQYIQKPIDGDKLDKAIHAAVNRPEKPLVARDKDKELQPFNAAKREMVIYENRITVLGVEVWHESMHTQTRDALALLSRKDQNGFVRIRGTKLTKDVGRQVTNQIGKPLADLCIRIADVMREKGLECGREDVIRNQAGGYHFRDWMVVRISGDWAVELGIDSKAIETPQPQNGKPLNERQQWIVAQLKMGTRLKLKDIVTYFRGKADRSTINRDLRDLRMRELIETKKDGAYGLILAL